MSLHTSSTRLLPAFDQVTTSSSAVSCSSAPSPSDFSLPRRAPSPPSTEANYSSSSESSARATPTHLSNSMASIPMNRTRSSSLAPSAVAAAGYASRAMPTCPLPALPAFPTPSPSTAGAKAESEHAESMATPRASSEQQRPLRTSGHKASTSLDEWLYPTMASVAVTSHTKLNKHYYYTCRVAPAVVLSKEGRSYDDSSKASYMIYRRWSEFVDFRCRLASAFPIVIQPMSPTETSASNVVSREVPRLNSKKSVMFVRQSTLDDRVADLHDFTQRLFEMPNHVKDSILVRDFFRLRESDVNGHGASTPSSASSSIYAASPPATARSDSPWGDSPNDGGDSFAHFLAAAVAKDENISPNATVRAVFPSKGQRSRPGLPLMTSNSSLRPAASSIELRDQYVRSRPSLSERIAFSDPNLELSRTSTYADSTTSTITPATMSKLNANGRQRSPLSLSGSIANADVPIKEVKKRPGLLRTIRSLGDLRGSSSQSPARPTEPMPQLSAAKMLRAVTQPTPTLTAAPASESSAHAASSSPFAFPLSSTSTPSLPTSSFGAYSPPMSRHRSNNSKGSSTSSFEDLWGGPYQQQAQPMADPSAAFRRNPSSGRVDRVPSIDMRPRRPSMPSRSTGSGSIRAATGHKSQSPSLSSLESVRSSRSSDMGRSFSDRGGEGHWTQRSSTDYSFSDISTPPTPQSEFTMSNTQKQELEQALSNKVPLPMFFPVPPSSRMEVAYSHEGLPHTPNGRRRPSLELRPRAASSSSSSMSRRMPLDTILASPKAGSEASSSAVSSPSASSASGSIAPYDRPYISFKLLHPTTNLVVRMDRNDLNQSAFIEQIRSKFAQAGIELEGDWGILYSDRTSGASSASTSSYGSSSRPIITDSDLLWLLSRNTSADKISLRVLV